VPIALGASGSQPAIVILPMWAVGALVKGCQNLPLFSSGLSPHETATNKCRQKDRKPYHCRNTWACSTHAHAVSMAKDVPGRNAPSRGTHLTGCARTALAIRTALWSRIYEQIPCSWSGLSGRGRYTPISGNLPAGAKSGQPHLRELQCQSRATEPRLPIAARRLIARVIQQPRFGG